MDAEIQSLLIELNSGDDHRAELAIPALSAQGNSALPALQEMLDSSDIDSRWWAVRCLAQMENPPLDLLVGSLEDGSHEVRQCAALAISHHPHISAIKSLLDLIQETESVTTNLAATALIAIGKEAIPGLLDLLPNLKDGSRIEAYRAIACIADQRAIPVLMSALDEDSLAINYWAEEGLNRLGLDMVYLEPD
ncbi:MAG: HEAT repeat domain-containing protein [Chloroflexota bacterium]